MRCVPETSSLARWFVLPLLILAGAGLAAVRWVPDTVLALTRCPLHDLTGLACPTCGGTRAALALTDGRWSDAWAANPLVPAGTVVLLVWAIWALLATVLPTLRRRLLLGPTETRAARIVAALVIAALWLRQITALA